MRKLLFVTVLLAVSIFLTPAPAAGQSGSVRVTAERTSVRDRAATDGAVIATVSQGEQLQVIEVAGSWFKVRTPAGREGFVYSLFIDRSSGGTPTAPPAAPTAAPPPATPAAAPAGAPTAAPAQSAQSPAGQARFGGNGTAPLGNRRFGVGLANIGPSMRYWMDSTKGFQVDGYFHSNFGYSVSAISPSFLMRFKEPKTSGSLLFAPYFGGGVTIYRFANGYGDYYCGRYSSCRRGTLGTLGFGGFVGGELAFENLPKLAVSGQAGFYTGSYGYGGLGIGLGVHYYPGARP